jgi:hypothetical protein
MRPAAMRRFFWLLLVALPLSAQSVVIGSQPMSTNVVYGLTAPYTLVDVTHPATADGTVAMASVRWTATATGCTAAFKLKFLRPSSTLALKTFTLVAERGPFTATPGIDQLAITPPVQVQKGDLIAVTSLVDRKTCGSPTSLIDHNSAVMAFSGDASSGDFSTASYQRGQSLAARATDSMEVLEGVIPAAGSLAGSNGSFFRTSLQISNPLGGTITGKLVFHPAGVPASQADQQIPYTISGVGGVAYDDIVQHMGKSGLGTIDVVSNNGYPPTVTARVYDDAGPLGTSGFTEEMVTPAEALHAGDLAVLVTPGDLTAYRVNVGVRTLGSATTINVQYGNRSQSNKDFAANTFQQFSLAAFGDSSPVPNEPIYFFVLNGDAIVYLSVIDNRTNDSSVVFARRK